MRGQRNVFVFDSKSSCCRATPLGVVSGRKKIAVMRMYCGGGIADNAFGQHSKEE